MKEEGEVAERYRHDIVARERDSCGGVAKSGRHGADSRSAPGPLNTPGCRKNGATRAGVPRRVQTPPTSVYRQAARPTPNLECRTRRPDLPACSIDSSGDRALPGSHLNVHRLPRVHPPARPLFSSTRPPRAREPGRPGPRIDAPRRYQHSIGGCTTAGVAGAGDGDGPARGERPRSLSFEVLSSLPARTGPSARAGSGGGRPCGSMAARRGSGRICG